MAAGARTRAELRELTSSFRPARGTVENKALTQMNQARGALARPDQLVSPSWLERMGWGGRKESLQKVFLVWFSRQTLL